MTNPLPSLNYQSVRDSRPNGLGIAGFVISLLGLLTCGLFGPVGLMLSILGVRRFPRGLAIAGLVMGILGTLELIVVVVLAGMAIHTTAVFAAAAKLHVVTFMTIQTSSLRVQTYRHTHGNDLPTDAQGNAMIAGDLDGWGRALRYRLIGPGSFEISSAGPDGIFDNGDDDQQEFNDTVSATATAPFTMPAEPVLER